MMLVYLRKVILLFGLCLAPAAAFAQGVDLFLVIGQSNARGRGPDAGVVPATGTAYEFNGSGFQPMSSVTGLPTGNYWTSSNYGPIPAFAKRWYELSGRRSAFVVRPAGGTGLTRKGDVLGNGYWAPENGITHPIYDRAFNDLINAYTAASALGGVDNIYVIWIQGENDAAGGVSYSEYMAGLKRLIDRLTDDLVPRTGHFIPGFFMAETGYFWGYDYGGLLAGDTLRDHRNRVGQIVAAQQDFQASLSLVVLVSKQARFFMSPCFNGLGAVGCGSWDKVHYTTRTYEALGAEMAENAWKFVSTHRKPLYANSCRYSPGVCGPTVDVYRWRSKVPDDHVAGIDPSEFDGRANYQFKGVRYHLFRDPASGRIPLYRKYNPTTGDYMDTTDSAEGGSAYGSTVSLGYCYAAPAANAPVPLIRVLLGTNHVTSKDPDEIAVWRNFGSVQEKILCYSR